MTRKRKFEVVKIYHSNKPAQVIGRYDDLKSAKEYCDHLNAKLAPIYPRPYYYQTQEVG